MYYISTSYEQHWDSSTSLHACYRKYAKKYGLKKMLTGHYETYNMILIFSIYTIKTTSFCIFIPACFKWKNVNSEEERKKYRRLRNEVKRATDNAKKEYLESICDEIIESQRRGRYDLMYMKTKELGWKENHGIQNIGIEDSQGNIIIDQKRVLQIWENYITELYDRANRPEHLEVEPQAEVDEDEKGPYILQSEVEEAIKEMSDKKATGDDDVPGDVLKL
jgi:uncharacterized membrane-anchored protein